MQNTIEFRSRSAAAATAIDASGLVRGVSVLTGGIEAKGHGVYVDAKTLETVKAVADRFGKVLVKMGHGTDISASIGHLSNFHIEGQQLKADLQLLKNSPQYGLVNDLLTAQPANIGLSISFSQTLEEIEGKKYVRCEDLFSVDLVANPAANPNGLFETARPQSFGQAIGAVMLSAKVSKGTAVSLAVTQYPDLYQAWLASGNTAKLEAEIPGAGTPTTFGDLVAAAMRFGKSKAQAIEFCIKKHPALYIEWRNSGNTSTL